MPKFVVIIPTYNESQTVEEAITKTLLVDERLDVLVVDDNSPDGTGMIADGFAKSNLRVKVLHRAKKEGLGPAYLAGYDWAINNGYDYLVGMDSDGSHRPEDLPNLLAAATKADLVIGSRYVLGAKIENWPFHRLLLSRFGNWYARFLLRSKVHDITGGFRVYKVSTLAKLDLSGVVARGYAFQVNLTDLVTRAGGTVIEVPITFVERLHGKSKMSKKIVIEAFWLVLKWSLARR